MRGSTFSGSTFSGSTFSGSTFSGLLTTHQKPSSIDTLSGSPLGVQS